MRLCDTIIYTGKKVYTLMPWMPCMHWEAVPVSTADTTN
jgi:hypothetical protein